MCFAVETAKAKGKRQKAGTMIIKQGKRQTMIIGSKIVVVIQRQFISYVGFRTLNKTEIKVPKMIFWECNEYHKM